MGILFNQRDKIWHIEVREKWLVPRDELDGVIEVLLDHQLSFNIASKPGDVFVELHGEVIVELNNASCDYSSFNKAQQTLLELIWFKKKFGQLQREHCKNKRTKEIFGGEDNE